MFGCSTKVVDLDSDPEILPEEIENNTDTRDTPFYPLKDSIEELQYEINELKGS